MGASPIPIRLLTLPAVLTPNVLSSPAAKRFPPHMEFILALDLFYCLDPTKKVSELPPEVAPAMSATAFPKCLRPQFPWLLQGDPMGYLPPGALLDHLPSDGRGLYTLVACPLSHLMAET